MARQRLFYGALATVGGLVLLESLFLPWYRFEVTVAGVEANSKQSAWQTMATMDVLLFLAAVAAVAGGLAVTRRADLSLLPCVAGVAGLVMSLVGLIALPASALEAIPGDTTSVGRELGGFIALVGSGGVAYAGFRAGTLRNDVRPRARGATPPRT